MHNFILSVVLNHSILIPLAVAVLRHKQISSVYFPFVIFIWLGFLNESLSLFRIYHTGSNAVNSNIYVLLESVALLYQFKRWNTITMQSFRWCSIAACIVWLADNCILNDLSDNNSLFRCMYAIGIVFLSVVRINKVIIYERGTLVKNPAFIICITFVLYYVCKSFIESFNAFHIGIPHAVLWNMWVIMYFVNAGANILYALAILCIQPNEEYTLPY